MSAASSQPSRPSSSSSPSSPGDPSTYSAPSPSSSPAEPPTAPPEPQSHPASPSASARSLPRPPTISSPDATQSSAINASLAKRRRRRRPAILRRASSDDAEEAFDPATAHAHNAAEAEACDLAHQHIELTVDGRVVHSEAELPAVPTVAKGHYAWEVMYENQRGISLFGKSWYSSKSLLPTDPTPFTLPLESPDGDFILARPGASDTPALASKARPAGASHEDGQRGSGRPGSEPQLHKQRVIKRRSIKTGYSLATYQTPSPAWVWLTPWMVDMRHDTDQQGWRYNLWFHTSQWASHPGRLNWWGWVRRREWVRLRALMPLESDPHDEEEEEGERKAAPESLDEILDTARPIAEMTRWLAACALDREKLEIWEGWLRNTSAEGRHKLADLFEDPEKLMFISRTFIYATPRKAFYASLVAQGIVESKDCMECADLVGAEVETLGIE